LVTVRRKEHEPFEVLARRFNRAVQLSGKLTAVKRKRFYERPLSKLKRRRIAIRKKEAKLRKLKELGIRIKGM
jgi:small subunit ribosomal protein S21